MFSHIKHAPFPPKTSRWKLECALYVRKTIRAGSATYWVKPKVKSAVIYWE